ncbi:hypothetical protein NSU_2033 [Novosphingobium pentaromativorans US6-1]|uniref:Uncharacterized protein n=1 Tax=Novosphingobium pentaromativorans US6-1 TaxID=1088721 RepID=G6ECG2_9SPHN|nr:hypothetical protein NSU_2033 [Novosphingobium pentaromativorans US6-1]
MRAFGAGPVFRHGLTVMAVDLEAEAAHVAGGDFETGRIDDAVDIVVLAIDDQPGFVDLVDAGALGIDQGDVVAIEGLEVFVVEARPLAHHVVPGLEPLGRLRICDKLVDAGTDLVHLFHVGQLLFFGGYRIGLRDVPEDLGPAVLHHVAGDLLARDDLGEVLHAFRLPARLERLRPVGIGGLVAARADGRGRALHDEEFPGAFGEAGDRLDRGGAGADDGDLLVGQLVHQLARTAAGIAIVPARGVERVTLELLYAGDAGQLGLVHDPARDRDEAGLDPVATIGGDQPAVFSIVPAQFVDQGLEQGVGVKVVMPGDPLAVLENLGCLGVLLGRDVTGLFKERHVDVRFDVAGRAGIAVPVPGSAEVSCLVDDAHRSDALLGQPRGRHQSGKTGADNGDLALFLHRIAGESRVREGVLVELALDFLKPAILVVAVIAQTLVAFRSIALLEFLEALKLCAVGGRHYTRSP